MPDRFLTGYVFVFLTLLFTVIGQISLKWRATEILVGRDPADKIGYVVAMFSDFYVWGGLGMAVVASVCWMLAIQNLPISVAYPFMGLSFFLVPLAAAALFGESLSLGQGIGMALIVGGVALTGLTK